VTENDGSEAARIRIDEGVVEGGEVSMFYDPMIAKLITWAPTREAAIDAQIAALDAFEIEGPGTNLDFLSALMQHPRFRSGEITTGFIAEEYPDGFRGAPAPPELIRRLTAIAAGLSYRLADATRQVSGQLGDPLPDPCEWMVRIGGADHSVVLDQEGAIVDGERIAGKLDWAPGRTLATARSEEETLSIRVARRQGGWLLTTRGGRHIAKVYPAHVARLTRHLIEKIPPDLSRFLIAPMPGLLVRLDVAEGDKVEAGQPLAVVEAMKMENILRAEKSATVKAISAKQGESLSVDQVILEME